MVERRIRELSDRINEAIDELISEFPEETFVIIAATPVGDSSAITMTSNAEEEDLPDLFDTILSEELEDIPSHRRLLN